MPALQPSCDVMYGVVCSLSMSGLSSSYFASMAPAFAS